MFCFEVKSEREAPEKFGAFCFYGDRDQGWLPTFARLV